MDAGPSARAVPGFVISIMVDSVAATLGAIVAEGGKIVTPTGAHAPDIVARFATRSGNVIGLYQEPT